MALIQSLAATLAERYESDGPPPIQPRTLVEENKWRAARYGLDAELIDLARDEVRPAREAALELVELALPAARRLGCEAELDEIERLCERGSGSDEQRARLSGGRQPAGRGAVARGTDDRGGLEPK